MLEKSKMTTETPPGKATAVTRGGPLPDLFSTANNLMVRHHVHPISVHLPNGVLPVSILLVLLAVEISSGTVSRAALCNNLLVLLSLPVALYSGINAWRRKYGGRLTPVLKKQIVVATITTGT